MTTASSPATRVTAILLAALLGVTLADVPAFAAKPDPFKPPTAQKVPSVPVTTVKPGKAPAVATPPDASKKPAPVWPSAGQAEADVPRQVSTARGTTAATPARVGDTPVSVRQPAGAADAPGRVRVQVLDRATTAKAGVRGVLLRVGRTDAVAKAGAVDVTVDYKPFRTAYGADWATRLRLVALPDCALTTQGERSCAGTPLPSTNDTAAGTVSAKVSATTSGALLAVQADSSGPSGDYAATSLQASSTWAAGGNAGDFTWSYPMRVPPSMNGPAPEVALSYSAQSVDGRHAASNNQPSWIGEGFEMWSGYIERRYETCLDDMQGGANNSEETGDQCWATDNATLSLSGHSGELVYNASEDRWHLRSEDGSRIERKTGADNGDNDGEHWVVTTPDGVQYWFGLNKLPGAGSERTESAWTAPVFGNHSGEPCHTSTFASSSCTQAYRWNLDYVVDLHGNSASYWYAKETNKYGKNGDKDDLVGYVRDGYLRHVAYGTRRDANVDSVFSGNAPAQVVFGTADRCLSSCGTHDETHWPDVPWDQECAAAPCETFSPTFWSTKRLSTVTTQVWGGSSYRNVERWTLTHTFPDPGDTTRAGLWLSKISHEGLVGTAVGQPDVEFTPVQLANRVDPEVTQDHSPAMKWMRIAMIRNESGGTINITYSAPDCVPGSRMPTDLHANTLRCYPVYWQPDGYDDPILDFFHKYVVTTIYEIDHTGGVPPQGSPRVMHAYSYIGNPAWHYADDDGLIEKKEKTWSVWRGYERVGVTNGDPGEQTYVETRYFRGMHGDKQPTGTRSVQVTGLGVPTVDDADAYAGMPRESVTFNGPGGPEVARQVFEPWQSAPTASRTINGDIVEARFTNTAVTHDRVVLDAGRGTRVRKASNTFDAYGMVVQIDDAGDTAVSGDEQCTKTTFEPRNTGAWLVDKAHRSTKFAVACAQAANPATLTDSDVVSDGRTYYDGATVFGTAPTRGLATRNTVASAWNAGSPTYVTVERGAYDVHGRPTSRWDAMDKLTTTAYTPTTGGPVTAVTVTNPLDHVTTTTVEPAWGLTTTTVDPNSKRTDLAYDGLGRLSSVWVPGQDKATEPANTIYSYLVRNTAPSVVTTKTLNAEGAYVTSYVLYDSLLRVRQTQAPSPSGGRLLTDTFYDTVGRKVKEYGAYHDPAAPGTTLVTATDGVHVPTQTSLVYDGAGRTVASIFQPYNVERWRTKTYYAGDRTDVTPPAGGTVTSAVTDAQGRTVQGRQYRGTTPTGAHDVTTYTYNRKGLLERVTDPAGNHWDYKYDLRGRQVEVEDPDKGTTTSTYNNAGLVTTTTDERGKKLAYQYDSLGRKTGLFDNQISATARARWFFDSIQKGYPSYTVRTVGSSTYQVKVTGYSDTYQPTGQQVIIPTTEAGLDGTYESFATYRVDGSPDSIGYGATADLESEAVFNHYDENLGLLNRLTSTYGVGEFSYVADTDYNALGQVDQYELYTGLYSNTGSKVFQSFSYELETGRLTGIRTDRDLLSPNIVNNLRYTYDNSGNITKIADPSTGDYQCFTYDYLRRLKEAWTPGTDNCAAAPSAAGLGGPAKYWTTWTHNEVGNRLTQVEHATASGDVGTTYAYPSAGAAQPHTLTGTSTTVGGVTTTVGYTYDQIGNTLTRPTSGSGTQTLTWDEEGRLATSVDSTGTTTYIYDADGNRLIRRDPTGKTLYLPGQEVRFTTAGGTRTCTRYYSFGGQTFASRTAAGFIWLTGDHQGTAQIAIHPTTQQATIRRQTPYGTPRGPQPAWPNTKGFVGGTVDNTGLTHLGAREYDAGTGRFISVDPVMDLGDPQQMHGYSYASNSPITKSDATGLMAEGGGSGGGSYVPPGNGGGGGGGGGGNPGTAPKPKKKSWLKQVGSGLAKGWVKVNVDPMVAIYDLTITGAELAYTNVTAAANGEKSWTDAGLEMWDFKTQIEMEVLKSPLTFVEETADAIGASASAAAKGDWEGAVENAYVAAANIGTVVVPGGAAAAGAKGAVTGAKAAGAALRGAGRNAATKATKTAGGGCKNSFAPGTLVLLADGTTKPIETLVVGDRVLASDPESGETPVKEVEATIEGTGTKDLANVVVAAEDGETETLVATSNHPFWVASQGLWRDAADLRAGDELLKPDGARVRVIDVVAYQAVATVHNLTVADIHTYYVMAGNTPVLVHNCGEVSKYEDITRPGARMPNRLTDVGPREFGETLESNGWNRVDRDWGTVYEKEGARYQLRDHAKTHDGWTAEFFKPGSKKADLKIRLGED